MKKAPPMRVRIGARALICVFLLQGAGACSSGPPDYSDFTSWLAKSPRHVALDAVAEPGAVSVFWEESNAASDAGIGAARGAFAAIPRGGSSDGLAILLLPFFMGAGAIIGGVHGAATSEPTIRYYNIEEIQVAEQIFNEAVLDTARLADIEKTVGRHLRNYGRHTVTYPDLQESKRSIPQGSDARIDLVAKGVDFVGSEKGDTDLALRATLKIRARWHRKNIRPLVTADVETTGEAYPAERWLEDGDLLRSELDKAYAELARKAGREIVIQRGKSGLYD